MSLDSKKLHSFGELASGNIYLRPNLLNADRPVIYGHTHNFDHTTFVQQGKVRVIARKDGVEIADQVFTAPDFFLVKADVEHEIINLVEESLVYCIYAHRNPQGEIVQEYTGWEKAHL